ncbi:MAG: carboxypeptidase regulatory-like domain-containing protein [bacterium]|nr:carboxypeptidase regulatory-like domain-containing protein [bacterium]
MLHDFCQYRNFGTLMIFVVSIFLINSAIGGVNGMIVDSLSGQPIPGALIKIGLQDSTFTATNGMYNLPNVGAGTFQVEIRKYGYFNHYTTIVLQMGSNTVNFSLYPLTSPHNPIGQWDFDFPSNLLRATTGNHLVLQGNHTAVVGPATGNGAVNIGVGSFYRCYHNIAPNGGSSSWVNEYSILIDFRVSQLGRWYTFFQTNLNNSNDGDCFINPNGNIGVGATGYSSYSIVPNEWYRLVVSVDLGSSYTYYLDGQLLHQGTSQAVDGRFALYSTVNGNQILFFADENGEDNPIDVAQIRIYDRPLTNQEVNQLGGYGHWIQNPLNVMTPYLQTPTPNSITIGWHCPISTHTVVEYGTTPALGLMQSGSTVQLSPQQLWHQVTLQNLQPNTRYYYRCITDTAATAVATFHTPPSYGSYQGKLRFLLISDSQTNISTSSWISSMIEQTLIQRYGTNYSDSVHLILHCGDIVGNGFNLPSYQTEYFLPFSNLTKRIPFMVSIGNHESESPYFYNYMHYTPFGGDGGELYYSFQLGRVLFISLNSNTQGTTQLQWLVNRLNQAQNDTTIDMIFVATHKPGRSEVWPDGNTGWVYNSVMPILDNYSKVVLISFGHSHNYERGVRPSGNYRTVICGGAGGTLDRWRMYGNQTNYPEIHRSLDYYHYVLVEVSLLNASYRAYVYGLGNEQVTMNNVLVDVWEHFLNAPLGNQPIGLQPSNQTYGYVHLLASLYAGVDTVFSSQFQITNVPGNYNNPILNVTRHFEDYYYDTGNPEYQPINWNQGIELHRLNRLDTLLTVGSTYGWRMRYRGSNLKWTPWSEEQVFTWNGLSASDMNSELPQDWVSQNYPNPFNRTTKIAYSLSRPSKVEITLYNEIGQKVRDWYLGEKPKGNHLFELSGETLTSGIYYLVVKTDFYRVHKTLHLIQ